MRTASSPAPESQLLPLKNHDEPRLPMSEPLTCNRRILFYTLLSCIALLNLGFGPPRLVDREFAATLRLTPAELQQWAEAADAPEVGALALAVYDVEAHRVLYSRNTDEALPPASLTKLMTALLALESERLDETVRVHGEDLMEGATMGLAAGEVLTVQDLLWGILLPSGNDAAMAVARHLAGSKEGFVDKMNLRAQELGMEQTTFHNPHGLDEEGHVSSVDDLLVLTLTLMEYPLFVEMIGARTADVAGHILVNTNELLGRYPGATGVKTGTTPAAGECLIASIETEGRQVLILVLGSSDRYGDVAKLHELYRENYRWAEGDANDLSILNRFVAPDGRITPLAVDGAPGSALLHRWGDPPLRGVRRIAERAGEVQLGMGESGFATPEAIGSVEWRAGDAVVGEQTLRMYEP